MQFLICTEDKSRTQYVRDIIEKIIGRKRVSLGIFSQLSFFTVQNQRDPGTEMFIYLLPEAEALQRLQNVEILRTEIVKELSLADYQVICATKLP